MFFIRSNSTALLNPIKHKVSGFSFRESNIFLPKLSDPVVILEADENTQSHLVDIALEAIDPINSDPYGSVLWPAAYSVSCHILELEILKSATVLEIGSGTGLVSLSCALAGAKRVIATDYHPLSLDLINYSSNLQKKKINIETKIFDIKGSETLPRSDILVVADLLYEPALGRAVAHRIHQAVLRGTKVILGDSPNRPGRVHMLKTLKELGIDVSMKEVEGKTVTGFRHNLISNSATELPEPVSISILEL